MTKRCVICKELNPNPMIKTCGWDCAYKYLKSDKGQELKAKSLKRITARKNKEAKKSLETRPQKLQKLQRLVNQWVVHVRDVDKPCFTCGADGDIKYDASHRYHAGAGGGDRRRFEPLNIHKACSWNCNHYGGGMPAEYDQALDMTYGDGTADWLRNEANFKSLKEQYPTPQDIDKDIGAWRDKLRKSGLKPRV